MAKFLIPTPLRNYTNGKAEIDAPGDTVRASLEQLVQSCPRLRDQLFDSGGHVRTFVNLFINGDDIRLYDDLDTGIAANDTLEVLPAIAGGEGGEPSFAQWRADLQESIAGVSPGDVARLKAHPRGLAILDVRTAEEWGQGHLPGAVHLDRGFLELKIESLVPDRSTPILCYCQGGVRSLFAAQALQTLGYERVKSLNGGIQGWKDYGLPLVMPISLNESQRRRYLRHISMPEVGEEGQRRLLNAKVLLIGAGGLGCPAALYLAAAGVGTLGIVDGDVVDTSNLQRQVLHRDDRVGQLKTESARETLLSLNPDVNIKLYSERLEPDRVEAIFGGYDLVIDGTDNFTTRYLINDTAVRLGLPVVHGSVYRFEGQVSVFWAEQGPCYRCLYPAAPPPELAPSCAEGGVLGVLPGVIGVLQATEALKLLLGVGEPLIGRALRYDALAGAVRPLRFRKDPACTACGGTVEEAEPVVRLAS